MPKSHSVYLYRQPLIPPINTSQRLISLRILSLNWRIICKITLAVYRQLALNSTLYRTILFKDKNLNYPQNSTTCRCRLQTKYSPPSPLQLFCRRQRDHLNMRQTDKSGEERRGDAIRKYWMLQTAYANCLQRTGSSSSWWKADAKEIH